MFADNLSKYIGKTQIDVQHQIDVQSSNPYPISTSQAYLPQIFVLFSNSQIYCRFSLSQIDVTDICFK